MIPKIIHYCWFGKGQKPAEFQKHLDGWRKIMPEYEIKEWNEDNFDIDFCRYTREAYNMKSYAHVSDVCRLYALYNDGGIYFDTDVEVLKSFAPFSKEKSFIGRENILHGTAVIGSEKGQKWIETFLNFYRNRHFINLWGHPVRTPNTRILTEKIIPEVPPNLWPTIYPPYYFCGIDWATMTPIVNNETFSIHHFAASWRSRKTLKTRLETIIQGIKYRYFK